MHVRLVPAFLALAIALLAASCGEHRPGTRLRLSVWDGQRGRAYELRCDPARGTAPHPRLICAALRQHSNLLVGGPGLDHSCPSSPVLRVTGTYRDFPVDASFSPCRWVPGQDGEGPGWSDLLAGATGGKPIGNPFTMPRLSKAERARRRARLQRLPALHKDELRLQRKRASQLASGALDVVAGQKPDAVALAYLRDLARGVGLPDGPYPTSARIYSTTRRRAEGVLGFRTKTVNAPVYVLVLGFDYRDYAGRRHANGGALYWIVDAATLAGADGGGLARSKPRGLGPAVALSF